MEELTDQNLLFQREHLSPYIGGMQRIYKLANGYGLSAINGQKLHLYPFKWEIAVIKDLKEDGNFESLTYDTPLTSDVEVFDTVEETNAFIFRAIEWANNLIVAKSPF